MWTLIVWQLSFTHPIFVKTTFLSERECLYTGAQFEVMYRDTARPVEYKCIKGE